MYNLQSPENKNDSLEILGEIFVEFLFKGVILGFFRLIGKGIDSLKATLFGIKKPLDPIKTLEKKYLYKEIELTGNLNPNLISGLKGIVLEVIDKDKVFAEFYDLKGKQIEWNDDLVFEIGMEQFKLKK